jgi:hypothetical protein
MPVEANHPNVAASVHARVDSWKGTASAVPPSASSSSPLVRPAVILRKRSPWRSQGLPTKDLCTLLEHQPAKIMIG